MFQPTLAWYCAELDLNPTELVNVYLCGSRVYGTCSPDADWDYVAVVVNGYFSPERTQNLIEKDYISTGLYEIDTWKRMLEEHHPTAVVCHYTPKRFLLKEEMDFPFTLNFAALKFSWLRKSSSCFNRAKSVYHPSGDYKRMKKMIIHSFRYLLLAQQLLVDPSLKELDFTCANKIYYEIMELEETDWDFYLKTYKPMKEALSFSVFPKEMEIANFVNTDDIDENISLLKRNLNFPGTFEGQAKYHILEIIRKKILSEDEFLDTLPEYYNEYKPLKQRFDKICLETNELYHQIVKKCGPLWEQEGKVKAIADIISEDGGIYGPILFYMRNQNIDNAEKVFELEARKKMLEKMLFG